MRGIGAFWHFLSKIGHQKYRTWVPRDAFLANEGEINIR